MLIMRPERPIGLDSSQGMSASEWRLPGICGPGSPIVTALFFLDLVMFVLSGRNNLRWMDCRGFPRRFSGQLHLEIRAGAPVTPVSEIALHGPVVHDFIFKVRAQDSGEFPRNQSSEVSAVTGVLSIAKRGIFMGAELMPGESVRIELLRLFE